MIPRALVLAFLCVSLGKCEELRRTDGSNLDHSNSNSEQIYPDDGVKPLESASEIGLNKRGLIGGPSNVSTSDPTIVDLVLSSLGLLDEASDHSDKYKVIEITSATQQVVAGILYKINVLIAPTDCAKTDSKPAQECNLLPDGEVDSCEISIWDRPWLPQGRETTFKCENRPEQKFRSKRQILGGVTATSTSDPTIVDLARSSLVLLDGRSDHTNKYKVVEITSATQQVVAGTLYKINVLIAPTDCAKTDSKPAQDCNLLADGKVESCEISISDRSWLPQGRETTFKCENRPEQKFRSKRQILGGVTATSTSDPTIVDLARSSLVLLDERSDHTNKYKVVEITSATQQVVAGTLYKINVLIAPTDCAKTDSKPAQECNLLPDGEVDSCEISISDRSWLPQGRETTFKCENRPEQKFRSKRQILGGVTATSTSDPTIVDLARSSLVLLDERSDHTNKYKVVEITSATQQVVAGTLYKINVLIAPTDCAKTDSKPAQECNLLPDGEVDSCEISISDRSWLPQGRETTFKCENRPEQKFRSKRQILGGVTATSTSDPTIVDLARSSLVLLDERSDHTNKYKVVEITSATQQVVAGTLYKINVLIAPTDCAKTDSKPAQECNLLPDGEVDSCEISISDRSWLPQGRETTFKCENRPEQKFRSKRQILGGVTATSTSDPTIVDLARSSLVLLDGRSDHTNKYKVVEITSATQQVVAGTLYKINVLIAPTDCAKTDIKPAQECNLLPDGVVDSCEISISDRSWLPQGRETTVKCENRPEQKFRSKRQVPDGIMDISTSNPTIVDLARSSLVLLDGTSDRSTKYTVKEITRASMQIESGILYKINVLIAPSDCAKTDSKPAQECNLLADDKVEKCKILIWDSQWVLQERETTFKCDNRSKQEFISKRSTAVVSDIVGQNLQH